MKKSEEVLNKFLDTKIEVINMLQKESSYLGVVHEVYKLIKAHEEALKFAENQYTFTQHFEAQEGFNVFSSSSVCQSTPQLAKLYDTLAEILEPVTDYNIIQSIIALVESYSNKK